MRRSIIAILLPIAMAGGTAAQTVSDDPPAVAAAARRAIAERYVLPDVAAKLGTALASSDRYRGLTGQALAERIAAFYGAAAKGVKPPTMPASVAIGS